MPYYPPAPSDSSVLVQTQNNCVSADTTTTSSSFVTLATLSITTGANSIIVRAHGHISNASANINMKVRITVDGTSYGGGQFRSVAANIGTAFSLQAKVAVTAATHTVNLEWLTPSSTAQCRPASGNVDGESACLIVEEVSA